MRGIQNYKVVCDETNNSPEDIQQGRMNVQLEPVPLTAGHVQDIFDKFVDRMRSMLRIK